MVIAILLLVFLLFAGFLYFFSPSKNLYARFHPSFFIKNSAKVSPNPPEEELISYNQQNKKDVLKSIFATFDNNGDGFITKQELRESLKNIRIFMTEREVEEMIVKVDSNGDGRIDFEEFCFLYESMAGIGQDCSERKGDEEGDLKEAFDIFDGDKDGLISVEELGLVLSSLGLKEGKRVEDCKEMIRKVDMDGDGMVNFDEFKKMMRSGTSTNLISVF